MYADPPRAIYIWKASTIFSKVLSLKIEREIIMLSI